MRNIEFWKQEIHRWADAGIVIVLENDTDKSPDLMVQLAMRWTIPAWVFAWISGISMCFLN